jgi:dipeptidyl aminopeptidase/acylaminoacyl peptidase
MWAEAQDKGDPAVSAEVRDALYILAAPFQAQAEKILQVGSRIADVSFTGTGTMLVSEVWRKSRQMRTWLLEASAEPRLIFDRSMEDRYGDPGTPMMRQLPNGRMVLLTAEGGTVLFLAGDGASPEGNRPFVDRFDLKTGTSERLWRSEAPWYERPIGALDDACATLITSREGVDTPPNYFVRDLKSGDLKQLTDFPHPAPALVGVSKELITYTRNDGVELSATLYLPPGYTKDKGPLPMLMWAYPREFKSAAAASQVIGSPYSFTRVSPSGATIFLALGYAVLDGPTMPIIGEGDREPNDTYVQQLVASAQAAVDEVVRRGVADPRRIAVGGHSYGAFMTANLLAHCDLFAAGIARSGAYNRTLTPFGFQAEERTYWQAPEIYNTMSPFMHADQIREPILLIHGMADNNTGTFPLQTERFYNALKGHGATTRMVMLPFESHGYAAKESLLHMLWEMARWMETYIGAAR